ncbi:helix-turn-helix transcriptional regulator [Isoptericola sp. b515]|uniref:helix-turn-helix domain-containing protein n=1 Tax=Isoptericola sp. b515 TaxID=3064652 RepID=UPI002713F96D|nr:helix-turn-helix transcriptional regulator [Isoptericola sp. b515]MDO8147505.1 helix-turn-helix transcriptional regulator [Isoptericola sp. b515]
MGYAAKALGQAIRERREELGLSQEQLGKQAGYGTGAGVSVSRIESGTTRPGPRRFEGIALALQLTPGQLEDRAERRAREDAAQWDERMAEPGARRNRRALKERLAAVREETRKRADLVAELGEAFNAAHDTARDEFLLEFVRTARDIRGVPESGAKGAEGSADNDTLPIDIPQFAEGTSEARARGLARRIVATLAGGDGDGDAGAGVENAETYRSFMAAVLSSKGERGGPGPAGVTGSPLGRGGSLLLLGIATGPGTMLAASRLLFLSRRRSRAEEEQLLAQLDEADAKFDASQRGFDHMIDALTRATSILEIIGLHAGWRLQQWKRGLDRAPVEWRTLTPEQQEAYRRFVAIAACQIAVESLDVARFMTVDGADLEALIEGVDETLADAKATVDLLA